MSKTKIIAVRVAPELKDAFGRMAKKFGKTESGLILDIVTEYFEGLDEFPQKQKDEWQLPKSRMVGTRLNEKEGRALSKILTAEHKNISEFLLCLIRSRLTKEPHFSTEELNELRKANMNLLSIGRNLNQMVRAINSGKADSERFSERYANELKKFVFDKAAAISKLIKRNKQRDC
ncbi:MAG: hypothetical protein GY874_04415 [Desulfobacteraceae bacterium]|nr:hypothetical protein [Desulfobacteraceae bacterium]